MSSRGSAAETQNTHAPHHSRRSPSSSALGESFSRKGEPQVSLDVEKEPKLSTENDKLDGYGTEYFVLNSWNIDKINRDAAGQSGSLSSFSSSSGSGRNRPS